jgi:hypothetical protein
VTPDEFIGGKGAVAETQAPATMQGTIADDLDPSGRPYRRGGDHNDPHLGGGNYGNGWGRIVRTVFRIDEEDAFAKLSRVRFEKEASRLEYGELVDALDACSEHIVLASQLLQNAKVVRRMYELELDAIRAPMRKQAKKELGDEKVKGSGAITLDDINARIIELWPDEWRRQEENIARVKGSVDHVEELLERWKMRARELDGLVRTSRKV